MARRSFSLALSKRSSLSFAFGGLALLAAGVSASCQPGVSGDSAGGIGGSAPDTTTGDGTSTGLVGSGGASDTTTTAAQFMAQVSATASTGGNVCNSGPNDDADHDGWTVAQGDCNDCDPNVNPGAYDKPGNMVDEDCDGTADNAPTTCDSGFALNDVNGGDGAKTIELCQTAVESPSDPKQKKWGVLSAQYVRANGTAYASPGTQVGIETAFGSAVNPQAGKSMLLLSAGTARTPGQQGACGSETCEHNAGGTAPPGFPQDVPNCAGSTEINDDVGLEVKVRAPTNATGFSYNFKFYSFEYPVFVCSSYNDQFIALMNPAPQGSINGNISFDSKSNPVSVNLAYFNVCDPSDKSEFATDCFGNCPSPPSPYCPSGTAEMAGTGFDTWGGAGNSGGTSWLQTQAPVSAGEEFTIRFAIWNTGDQALFSSVLIDNFQWIANGGTVAITTTPAPPPQ